MNFPFPFRFAGEILRLPHQITSSFLVLLYAVLTVVGAGHGACAHHDDVHAGHDHARHGHAHSHTHECGGLTTTRDEDQPTLKDGGHSHKCLLCNWLGQEQLGDWDSQSLDSTTLVVAAALPSTVGATEAVLRETLPRGPPTSA